MNILITGEKGYIAKFLYDGLNINGQHNVIKKSIKNGVTKKDLEGIDVVVHLAAIVHKKEKSELKGVYERVNYQLTKELAVLSKQQGVKHFIFVSTMAVYGNYSGKIDHNTPTFPTTFYGETKLNAEKEVMSLRDNHFSVAIVRPPMVYGPRCPGNYSLLRKLSLITPIFPNINNKRSMIYIGNLIEFIIQLIKYRDEGIFHPQDSEFINTTNMVCSISKSHDKPIIKTKVGAYVIRLCIGYTKIYKKVFGNLFYDKSLSNYRDNSYQKFSFEEAIKRSEEEF